MSVLYVHCSLLKTTPVVTRITMQCNKLGCLVKITTTHKHTFKKNQIQRLHGRRSNLQNRCTSKNNQVIQLDHGECPICSYYGGISRQVTSSLRQPEQLLCQSCVARTIMKSGLPDSCDELQRPQASENSKNSLCYTLRHVHSTRVHTRSQRPRGLALLATCLPELLTALLSFCQAANPLQPWHGVLNESAACPSVPVHAMPSRELSL